EEAGLKAQAPPAMDPASPDIAPLLSRHAAMYAPPPPPPSVQRPSALAGTLSPRPPATPSAPGGRPVAEASIQVSPQVTPATAVPPPVPAAARSDDLPALPAPRSPEGEDPGAVMPRIYVRPNRKRKVDSDEKKRRRAMDAEGRRRKLTLPGMPPSRVKTP
ncbi:MAG TPA: hypothetical protein VGF45_13745, partial [Polyangia bacterium]